MNNFSNRKQALEEKISELEDSLAALKARLKAEEEREQHEAIERLDEFLGDIDNKTANLQEFWSVLREELRSIFSGKDGDTGAGK